RSGQAERRPNALSKCGRLRPGSSLRTTQLSGRPAISNLGNLLMANTPPNDSEAKKNAAEQAGAAQGANQPQDAGAEGVKSLQQVVAALQAEVNDLKDKWLRANAEAENIRKRAEKEREDAAKYAISKLALDVVNVGDNFQRAIDAVPPGAAERDQTLK